MPAPCQSTFAFTGLPLGPNEFVIRSGSIEIKRFSWTIKNPPTYVFAVGSADPGYGFVFQMDQDTGVLTYKSRASSGATPNWGGILVNKKFAFSVDYGADTATSFNIQNPLSISVAHTLALAEKPRVMAAHPHLSTIYVGSNLVPGSVTAIAVNPGTGVMSQIGSPVAATSRVRAVSITPDGKFLYAANWYDSTLSIYSIDQTTGALTGLGTHTTCSGPVGASHDPAGKFVFVACQWSNDVGVYSINSSNGQLTQVAGSPFAGAPAVVDVRIAPNSTHALALGWGADVTIYSLNSSTGALSIGSSFNVGGFGTTIAFEPAGKFVYFANYSSPAAIKAYHWSALGLGAEVVLGTVSSDLDNAMTLSFW